MVCIDFNYPSHYVITILFDFFKELLTTALTPFVKTYPEKKDFSAVLHVSWVQKINNPQFQISEKMPQNASKGYCIWTFFVMIKSTYP